jgi:hypothetical protein
MRHPGVKKLATTVMQSPFALPLRTALSAAKGLRVNSATHPCIYKIKQIQGFFLGRRGDLLRMTGRVLKCQIRIFSHFLRPGLGYSAPSGLKAPSAGQ